jgi:hypothetical protein
LKFVEEQRQKLVSKIANKHNFADKLLDDKKISIDEHIKFKIKQIVVKFLDDHQLNKKHTDSLVKLMVKHLRDEQEYSVDYSKTFDVGLIEEEDMPKYEYLYYII